MINAMIFRILNILGPEQKPLKCGKKMDWRGKYLPKEPHPAGPACAVLCAHMQNVGRFQPGNSLSLLTQHWVLSHSYVHDVSSSQSGGGDQKPAIHFLVCL